VRQQRDRPAEHPDHRRDEADANEEIAPDSARLVTFHFIRQQPSQTLAVEIRRVHFHIYIST
jgi:hypothetical protein